jgi:hypothetical protein
VLSRKPLEHCFCDFLGPPADALQERVLSDHFKTSFNAVFRAEELLKSTFFHCSGITFALDNAKQRKVVARRRAAAARFSLGICDLRTSQVLSVAKK